MIGRLYIICLPDNKAILTMDIEPIGQGRFLYIDHGVQRIATSEYIYCFGDDSEHKGINSLSELIRCVWMSRYAKCGDWVAKFDINGCSVIRCTPKTKEQQTFVYIQCKSLANMSNAIYIGSEGDLILSRGGAFYPIHVIWDESLAPSEYTRCVLRDDGFKYYVTYVYTEKKPPVGFGRISNVIVNYISAFPNGISSKEVEDGLKLRHPSVAGRISDLTRAGRIQRINSIRYFPQGKANSIWVISTRE